ncbi:YcxB family protein [Teredinibacter sp. KSP-S5-2]|uniref:YcxB family protein n=1 Tax=Teredinibacter sp. KSP-S5-2 TaxID=3034506 RepID=UPI002934D772|nr:YcxB family protein [Teredinibacter sp. KSP-S5-2]WNO08251.1 YcxB family protein [Teredinibacter sp. KSP-S5-2]
MQPFTTQFVLSKEYLAECFDQTLPYGKSAKPNFMLPIALFAAGVGVVYIADQVKVLGFMLIALAVLELVHIRYRRSWWLIRQTLGRSFNCEVQLTIDDGGIQTKTPYTETVVQWKDLIEVIETELGIILVVKSGGRQYLSKSILPDDLVGVVLAGNND